MKRILVTGGAGFIGSHLRQECLDQHWFSSLEDAKIKIEAWRIDYNMQLPHSSDKKAKHH